MYTFEDADHVDVFFGVRRLGDPWHCCSSTHTRIFLFSGYSDVLLPLCPFVSP